MISWQEAEQAAARHTRSLGFGDADVTGMGADGGVDVRGSGVIAQVKHYAKPVGIAEVQRLRGTLLGDDIAIFYATTGFTRQAVQFAEQVGMPLFSFGPSGKALAENAAAMQLQANSISDVRALVELDTTLRNSYLRLIRHLGLWATVLDHFLDGQDLRITMGQLVAHLDGELPAEYVQETGFAWLQFVAGPDVAPFMSRGMQAAGEQRERSAELKSVIDSIENFTPDILATIRARLRDIVEHWETLHEEAAEVLPVAAVSVPDGQN